MKYLKLIILLNLFLLVFSCGTLKEGFKNQKKNNSDEFLVEKKSPLVMPPEFNKLPIPGNNEQDSNSDQKTIKNLLNENGGQSSVINDSSNESLEKTLLEKIKKN